jgi:CRISPR-associated protein (TIGR03986 family)
MNPKHVNPTRWEQRREAIAPYNFVPLPEKAVTMPLADVPDHHVYQGDRLSGYIDCTLTTESPVYVRGMLTPEQYQAQKAEQSKGRPEFFHVEDVNQPVIPGSSLRGLLRMMVEIVGFGKMAAVTPNRLVYRAVGDTTSHGLAYRNRLMHEDGEHRYTPLMRGGYMEKRGGDWFIRPAKEIDGTTFAVLKIDEELFRSLRKVGDCRNAAEIYIATGPYDYQAVRGGFLHIKQARVIRASARPGQELRRGTLARSGRMMSKRNEAVVYEADPEATLLALDDDQIQAYKDQLSQEQKKLLGDRGVLNPGQPVFYVLNDDGSVFFFGHTRLFRLPYPRSPWQMVPGALRNEAEVDLAEALFGYVKSKEMPDGKARAYAGRVTVSDARVVPGQANLWLSPQPLTPKILSGPKATTFQHYLTQSQPDLIEVDRTRDDRPKYEVNLNDYAAPSTWTTLRGYKLYWHKGTVQADDVRERQTKPNPEGRADTQHTEIQPVRAGVKFQFQVRFDNLSPVELGALWWVLDLASGEAYRLKLGMGKPLGLGAVKIEPQLQLVDRTQRYGPLFSDTGWAEGAQADAAQMVTVAKAAFERFVLETIGERQAAELSQVERVKMLLALLSWPGPDPTLTRYMEIEHPDPSAKRGKRNEYDGRPVLPDPLNVGNAPETRRPKVLHKPDEKPSGQGAHPSQATAARKPSSTSSLAPTPEPPKTDEAVSQAAKDLETLMKQRAAEREAAEERKRQLREAKKNKKK